MAYFAMRPVPTAAPRTSAQPSGAALGEVELGEHARARSRGASACRWRRGGCRARRAGRVAKAKPAMPPMRGP